MGSFLDHPKVEKLNDSGDGKKADDSFKYALSSMQGWRIDMEDAHHVIVSLKDQPPFHNWSFFAVFDGHAGSKVAAHSAKNLLQTLLDTKEFKQIAKEMKDKDARMNDKIKKLVEEGLMKGFMKLDENILKLPTEEREKSGTTAICAILTPEYIFFANLGDSRGVLSRKSCESFGTMDHKPYLDKERERIQKAGGSVMIQRVNGSLAVSRALGDFDYKTVPNLPQNEQLVSPEPDIYIIERNKTDDEFLVLACDGIFDVLNNTELCELIRSRLTVTSDLSEITNQVLDICLSKGSRDNMTLLLVVFDSAPKTDPSAIEYERQWSLKVEEEINNVINSMNAVNEPDPEALLNHLKKKEENLNFPQPGGIHLARSVIHRVLDSRSNSISSSSTSATNVKESQSLDDGTAATKNNSTQTGAEKPAADGKTTAPKTVKSPMTKKSLDVLNTPGAIPEKLDGEMATEVSIGKIAAEIQKSDNSLAAGDGCSPMEVSTKSRTLASSPSSKTSKS